MDLDPFNIWRTNEWIWIRSISGEQMNGFGSNVKYALTLPGSGLD